jgi:hypothetical protein
MKYIVYLTINTENNKIYIGVHSTENPKIFDGYLGNGVYSNSPKTYQKCKTAFQSAVTKYGPNKFIRNTIKIFDTLDEALKLEAELVTEEFLKRSDVYNIEVGGGYPPKLTKCIYQYDLEGNFLKEWDSIKTITTYYGVNKDRIRMVIDGKRSFENSYWSEEKFEVLDVTLFRPSARGSIRQYTTSGIYLNTFKNTTEAAKQLDIERGKITNAIYGKYATSGYWFLKEGEDIKQYLDGSIKKEKPIYCYTQDGNFYKEYLKFKDIEFKFNKPDLIRAMKINQLLCGYYWSTCKYDNICLEDSEFIYNIPKKVYQYTLNDELVKEWDSITTCKKEFPSALQVCLGKRNHCKGFKFTFNKLMI